MKTTDRIQHLRTIAETLTCGSSPEAVSVRELIGWFGALRRGTNVNWRIRRSLNEFNLATVPDFESTHIEGRVRFSLRSALDAQSDKRPTSDQTESLAESIQEQESTTNRYIGGAETEPAYRVSRLLDPNLKVISIGPDAPLEEAVTLMLRHDYSQLPVMTNTRTVRGVISWDSIGPTMTLGKSMPLYVRECTRPQVEVKDSDSLFQVIDKIIENSYVLVRNQKQEINGILTTTDLSQRFQDLAEPFLLIGEIENHIRSLIDGRFTQSELAAACKDQDVSHRIESVADLTFGDYIRLIENSANWGKLELKIDRTIFINELDEIRILRNDVMHFDSDRIMDDERKSLRKFVQFVHQLKAHQAPAALTAKHEDKNQNT